MEERGADMVPCRGARRMDGLMPTGVVGTYLPGVHSNCWHNEMSSLLSRTLGPVPPEVHGPLGTCVEAVWQRLRQVVRNTYSADPWSLQQTALSYSGRLRRRYTQAAIDLSLDGLRADDHQLSPFLKAEKIWCGAKQAKPRMIFARHPRYNLSLARYLKPFEHWLWGRLSLRWLGRGKSKTRLVMKGLGPRARAGVLLRKFRSFHSPVVFEVDGKAFEAHVGVASLKAEHSVYKSAYPGSDDLPGLLSKQLELKGTTAYGIAFRRDGGRASGDFNTGMGNSLIMVAAMVGVCSSYGVPFDLAVDGDNALIFLEAEDVAFVTSRLHNDVRDACGQELVLENPVNQFERIRFGQCQPVWGPDNCYVMVRDYREVISKSLATHRFGRHDRGYERFCRGVAECELSCFRGMPIIQTWCLNILDNTRCGHGKEGKFVDFYVQGLYHVSSNFATAISYETRESFHKAFGLSPEEQHMLEDRLSHPRYSCKGEVEVPKGVWWDSTPGVAECWAEAHVLGL